MSVTQPGFRRAVGCFAMGVTVITVDHDGEVPIAQLEKQKLAAKPLRPH